MNFSDLVAAQLKKLGYTHCFFVPGGGSMHLLNAFRKTFDCIPVVHEVAAGIATESFNETSENQKAFALVTSGPGFTNIVTAIAQAFVEFRPLLVIGGQVKSSDLAISGVRQRGVQEINGKEVAGSITCKSLTISAPIDMKEFVEYVELTNYPSPGPVFIEICLDIQARNVADEKVFSESSKYTNSDDLKSFDALNQAVSLIKSAERPLFVLGNNLSRNKLKENLERLSQINIPMLCTTSSIDRLASDHELNFGFGGTWGGNYHSNVILSQSDLIVALGAKLDLQSTGYNIEEFIGDTKIIQIFPDNAELNKAHFKNILKINYSPDQSLDYLLDEMMSFSFSNKKWLEYCKMVRETIPRLMVKDSPNFINPQKLIYEITNTSDANSIISFCSSGSASFTHALQAAKIKFGHKVNVSPSFASMGVGLPAAIGCAIANPKKIVYHFEGDGGFAQNIQEIGTIKRQSLAIKLFIFDNAGFASIKNTQKKYFDGSYLGCDRQTGLGLPDWTKLFSAYDIPSEVIDDLKYLDTNEFKEKSSSNEPFAWIVKLDPNLDYLPAVTTKINSDGSMTSEPLSKMLPELSEEAKKRIYTFKTY